MKSASLEMGPSILFVSRTRLLVNTKSIQSCFRFIGQIKRGNQQVMSKGWKTPKCFPTIGEDVVLEENSMLQAGRQGHVSAHDVDAVVMQRASQVKARLGRVLLEVEPLPGDSVVGLHGEHVLTLAAPPVGPQLVETPPHDVDGLLHRHHLLLANVDVTCFKEGPEVGGGAVLKNVHVPV